VPLDLDDVAHLLRRTGYAASRMQASSFTSGTLAQLVDTVLDITADPPVVEPPLLLDTTRSDSTRLNDLTLWWFNRMATSPTPIVEKLTAFWHGHFTTEFSKLPGIDLMWGQHVLYRANAMGNFRAFTHAMALDPAMLFYLDNRVNVKASPNQNFARELQELFTIGVGNYTEQDVAEASRAWTGHGTGPKPTYSYEFHANQHDSATKTFYGTTKNWDGPDTIDEILDNSTKRPITAAYICTQLWEYFAHPVPPPGVIDTLAAVFIAANFDIKPVLRAMFLLPEFYAPAAKQGLVRTPVDYVASVLRLTGRTAEELSATRLLGVMGQVPFSPPNVAGWKANAYWFAHSAVLARFSFARTAAGTLKTLGFPFDSLSLTVADAVTLALDTFGVLTPTADTVGVLTRWLTDARAHGWAEQTDLMALAMLSPEFQVA